MKEATNPRAARYEASHPPPQVQPQEETPTPVLDAAAKILYGEPGITDDDRANIWDLYHVSKDSSELADHLQNISVLPDDTKHRLFRTKQLAEPAPSALDRAVIALSKLNTLDPKVLELAESHPTVAKSFVDAVTRG